MIKLKEIESQPTYEVESIKCDICNKTYNDTYELLEFTYIRKECGYSSVFGDGDIIEIDICQHCLRKIIVDNIVFENSYVIKESGKLYD